MFLLAQPFETFGLARRSAPFSHVGELLAPVGHLFASVRSSVALVSPALAAVRRHFSACGPLLASAKLGLSHLQVDLVRLDVRRQTLDDGSVRATLLSVRLDQLSPAELQRRTRTRMQRRVPMQCRAGVAALSLPESRGVLMSGSRCLMPCRSVAVAFGRLDHRPSIARRRAVYPTFSIRLSVGTASGEWAPRYRVNASRSISPPSGSVHERKTV
jgi:hypothetical protein